MSFSIIYWIFRKYMKQGVSVFLDVPLDALARRIAAVGTDSRPLLHFESGDAYTKVATNSNFQQWISTCLLLVSLIFSLDKNHKVSVGRSFKISVLVMLFSSTSLQAFVRLFTLFKKRTEEYANADATVSLQRMYKLTCSSSCLLFSSIISSLVEMIVLRLWERVESLI